MHLNEPDTFVMRVSIKDIRLSKYTRTKLYGFMETYELICQAINLYV